MTAYENLSVRCLTSLPPHSVPIRQELGYALSHLNRKIVVLDDDPTGVQTVNGIYVYTHWDAKTMEEAFRAPEHMFFILTNSRGLTVPESRAQHREIAENIALAAAATGKVFCSSAAVTLRFGDTGRWRRKPSATFWRQKAENTMTER